MEKLKRTHNYYVWHERSPFINEISLSCAHSMQEDVVHVALAVLIGSLFFSSIIL